MFAGQGQDRLRGCRIDVLIRSSITFPRCSVEGGEYFFFSSAILTSIFLLFFGFTFNVRCFDLKTPNIGGCHGEQRAFHHFIYRPGVVVPRKDSIEGDRLNVRGLGWSLGNVDHWKTRDKPN